MLKEIVSQNYKCFRGQTKVELAPLTILCGTNSSGKSSILKNVLLIKQTVESKSPDASLVLSGELVDNGTFDDVVYNSASSKANSFSIEHVFEIHNHKLHTTGKYIKRQDAQAFNELRRIYDTISGVISKFEIHLNLNIVKQKKRINEFTQYIADNRIKNYTISISAYDLEGCIIPEGTGCIKFENEGGRGEHYLSWENIPGYAKALTQYDRYSCTCSFNGLVISSVFAYNMPEGVKSIIPNILTIDRITFAQYEGINLIAPLRHTPERTYLIKGNVNSVGLSGENTPTMLAKLKGTSVLNDFEFMGNSKSNPQSNNYFDIIQYWLDFFGVGKLNISGKNGAIAITLDKHNIADVGFGVSQILPILTQGLYMSKGETLLVEQPEIHLHPKMELAMADFLIELAKSERNIIVETHSDHIINRVIHRVMEKYDSLEPLVKIYFVENKTEEAIVNPPIIIDKYKGTKIEYQDFFTQYTTESREIMSTGLANMLGIDK